jgi:GT2 family glycosyltransferase
MDDDAIPNKNSLEMMVKHPMFNCSDTGILAPIVYGIDKRIQKYHHKVLDAYLNEFSALGKVDLYLNDISTNYYDEIKLDANCFVGPLLSRKAIAKVGYPNKEFFIYADDLEYTFRISRHFNLYLIPTSQILHKDFNSQFLNSDWKTYYTIRNIIIFKTNYLPNKYKIIFHFQIIYKILRNIIKTLLRDNNKFARIRMLLYGYYDGLKGKTLNRFKPWHRK